MATEVCDKCGREFKNVHALSMHNARTHSGKNWSGKRKKAAPRKAAPVKRVPRQFDIVLKEAWSDKNGRILLTDQDDNWWVARKLDV